MSLIALTDRLHAGRTVARTLLLLIAPSHVLLESRTAIPSLSRNTDPITVLTSIVTPCVPIAYPSATLLSVTHRESAMTAK